jgi:RecG-like helicase
MVELHWDLDVAVGDKTAKVLAKELKLRTVEDLLRFYPRRYIERGELTELSSLREDEQVTVLAMVKEVRKRTMRNRRGSIVEAVVTDGTGELHLTFFNQPWHEEKLRPERIGLFAGKVGSFRGIRQLAHPEYKLLDDDTSDLRRAAASFADAIIPVYPATKRLASWRIEKCISVILDQLPDIPDPIPADVLRARRLPALAETFHAVHRPADMRRAMQASRSWRSCRSSPRTSRSMTPTAGSCARRSLPAPRDARRRPESSPSSRRKKSTARTCTTMPRCRTCSASPGTASRCMAARFLAMPRRTAACGCPSALRRGCSTRRGSACG